MGSALAHERRERRISKVGAHIHRFEGELAA
jgi:hypothetical protein